MSTDIAKLVIEADSSDLLVANRRMDQTVDKSKKVSGSVDKMADRFEALKRTLGLLAVAAATAVAAFTAGAIQMAIDAEETASKFQVVFRGGVEATNQALIDLTRTIPMTLSEMRAMAAGVQDMLVPMGIARDVAAELSVQAIKLAGDIGSFSNAEPEVVMRAIASGLAGQTEALRKYGIVATQAVLETVALENGLIAYGEEMTASIKAQALFIKITEDSADAMGDAERTMMSTANQLKFMHRELKQTQEDLGQALLPTLNKLLTQLNTVNDDGVTPLQEGFRTLGKTILTIISAFIIVKTTAGLLGKSLLGLGANVMHSLMAIAAPFTEFITTMGNAAVLLAKGKFGAAADAFDGLYDRIVTSSQTHLKAAGDALGFIGDSVRNDVGDALDDVTMLMNAFSGSINRGLGEPEGFDDLGDAIEETGEKVKLTGKELEAYTKWWQQLRAEMDPVAEATRQYELAVEALDIVIADGTNGIIDRAAAIAHLQEVRADDSGETALLDWLEELVAAADPVTAATVEFEAAIEKLDKAIDKAPKGTIDRAKAVAFLTKEMEKNSGVTEKNAKAQEKLKKALDKYKDLKAIIDPAGAALLEFNDALIEMNETRKVLEENGDFFGDQHWDDIEAGLERAILGTESLGESLEKAGALAGDALRLIQSSMSRNTKEWEAMNVAIQVANVAKAIGAVLTQGQGDPYTAFARMAAMAAAVAALGVSIGSFSNAGGSDPTAERQADQGTGSVLGDAEAKSESIMNALEITADSTSELVGINRGMLNALRSLQTGLTGASTQLIRGGATGEDIPIPDAKTAGWVDLLTGGGILDIIGMNFIGDFLSKVLGGKTKLLDTGLEIEGGAIVDLMNDVFVRAFAEIKSKKWFGGKYKFKSLYEAIEPGVGKQLALVFGSIVDTVTEAAIALGLPLDDIEERIAAFEVATQKISMEDMTGKEQQEALLAVFSKIFDDLAIDVVPFIDQFQKVGEGLGETLVRVASSVQVVQEATKLLGLSLDETDPEKFAQIAVGLVEMAGGVDQFITKMKNFLGKFSTEEWQDASAIDAVTRGFEQLGITLPETREGLWEMVQGLDLSTQSGRETLAVILDLTNSLDTYYDIREKTFNAEIQALLHIQSIAEGVSNSLKALRDRIIGETSTDEENYNRYKAEADALVVDLSTMTNPDLIEETVKEIERLTGLAWGLLDESQKQQMGGDFLAFLEGVEEIALERLGLAADEAVAGTEFTPEEILARFNELVTNPLILVAEVQNVAAMKLDTAADKLLDVTGADFEIQANADGDPSGVVAPEAKESGPMVITTAEPIPVVNQFNTPEAIATAVQKGMEAGAEAIVEAATSMASTGESTNDATISSARTIARAVAGIPDRIVVETTANEFS
jgi:tetratricopeptide (TPR) repeat protein